MDAAARTSVPAPGTLVGGRYRVGSPIGEGGMGVVLAARDEREVREVAIKLLQVVGEQNIERFLREARLSMKIDSQHVVRVLDVGTLGSCPFFVMERLEGEDFGAKIREGELALSDVADCVIQTCEALAHAHGAGIVHRDIKASNLFEHLPADGSTPIVKVLDFGISKMFVTNPNEVERTLTRTRDGGFLGSPPYMSPEHVKDPRNVDGRADLWSLGVVAYRLLSTQFPFPGETTGEVLAAILEGKPKRLRSLGVAVPDSVDTIIIERCLARNREERFSDAGGLARAFAPFASPRWRDLAERVVDVVGRGMVPSPIERSSRRKAVEPSTATVPPPVEDDPTTLSLDDTAARVLLQQVASQSSSAARSEPPAALAPMIDIEILPSPLDVLSTGPLPFTRAVEEKPKSSSSFGLIIALTVALLAVIGGIVFILTRTPAPVVATDPSPPSSVPAVPSVTADRVPAPLATAAPTAPSVELPSTPATTKPTTRRTNSGARVPAPPAPRPAPPAAPQKKPELEGNPYDKPPK